jgi:hypothetical protein
VGITAGLNIETRGKIIFSAGDRTPAVQSVVRDYTDPIYIHTHTQNESQIGKC